MKRNPKRGTKKVVVPDHYYYSAVPQVDSRGVTLARHAVLGAPGPHEATTCCGKEVKSMSAGIVRGMVDCDECIEELNWVEVRVLQRRTRYLPRRRP